MRNIKIILEYDGTGYHGFQRQGSTPTVQLELEKSLDKILGYTPQIVAAGRTDAGVHALGQVVNFKTHSTVPVARWPFALNSLLPDDIAVIGAEEVDLEFNARNRATSKIYKYFLLNASLRHPVWRKYALRYSGKLNIDLMKQAADCLVGRHDFRAFMASGSGIKHTVRHVILVDIQEEIQGIPLCPGERLITITIEANGFLYNMVRIIVGTLMEVGRGRLPPDIIDPALKRGDRQLLGDTVPAHGLWLWQVKYPTLS